MWRLMQLALVNHRLFLNYFDKNYWMDSHEIMLQTFVVSRGWASVTLGIPWLSIFRHHRVKMWICSILWFKIKYLQKLVTFNLSCILCLVLIGRYQRAKMLSHLQDRKLFKHVPKQMKYQTWKSNAGCNITSVHVRQLFHLKLLLLVNTRPYWTVGGKSVVHVIIAIVVFKACWWWHLAQGTTVFI